jgi:hypothetical protein
MLTRQNTLVSIGMIVVWGLICGWRKIMTWKTTIINWGIMAGITLVLIAPWAIRNYVVSGYFVPVATGSGTILAGAYNDEVLESKLLGNVGMWTVPEAGTCCDKSGEQPEQKDRAIQWIINHPGDMPKLLGLHVINMWWPTSPDGSLAIDQFPDQPASKLIKLSMRFLPLLLLLLACAGIVRMVRMRRADHMVIYLAIGLTILQCIILYGSVRFRAPIDPLLIILAAALLARPLAEIEKSKLHKLE